MTFVNFWTKSYFSTLTRFLLVLMSFIGTSLSPKQKKQKLQIIGRMKWIFIKLIQKCLHDYLNPMPLLFCWCLDLDFSDQPIINIKWQLAKPADEWIRKRIGGGPCKIKYCCLPSYYHQWPLLYSQVCPWWKSLNNILQWKHGFQSTSQR